MPHKVKPWIFLSCAERRLLWTEAKSRNLGEEVQRRPSTAVQKEGSPTEVLVVITLTSPNC